MLLASVGADAFRVRLTLFVLAALLAGLAGWLYAHMNRFVSPSPFDVRASIEYLLMAVGGGLGQLSGALAGAAVVLLLKNVLQDTLPLLTPRAGQLQAVAFAVLFILLLQHARGGLMGFVRRWTRGRFAAPEVDTASLAGAEPLPRRTLPAAGAPILAVSGAVKRFGGLVAVDDVSFEIRAGEIVGLIGPNGAGKSTMFNLLTRTLPMTAGRIEFLGRDVSALSQRHARAPRHGAHLPARQAQAADEPARQRRPRRPRPHALRPAGRGLPASTAARSGASSPRRCASSRRIGLAERAHEMAGSLPLGTQRILEIARALAADPVLLVLDEPAAGLRRKEKDALGDLLRRLRGEGVTILIVEHDMDFVMKLVDRLVVMNFGAKLVEGAPAAVRADARVQAAYPAT